MGRGRGKGKGRGGGRQRHSGPDLRAPGEKQEPTTAGADERDRWLESTRVNASFEEYYKAQNLIPESEWETFMQALRTELPTTFRVTGSRAHAQTLNKIIENTYVPLVSGVELDGVIQNPPKQLEWYPGRLAWQLSAPKRTIRKSPEFKVLQRFLVGETEIGNLSRQEAVSMIPPLLLDVKPHHRCLDMCAAPGSKTAQIMEALATPADGETLEPGGGEGCLIANDSDYKRCHMLVHQTARMPSTGLVVTNIDASQFPNIWTDAKHRQPLLFDRILADVPCTGDGTLRKNIEIWEAWVPQSGNTLHPLQLRILQRAMQLLKPGGKMVYSTCSFNAVENEAVVAAALNSAPGEYRLVPQSMESALVGLKRRPGISDWKVASGNADKSINWHSSAAHFRGFMAGHRAVKSGAEPDQSESDEFKAGFAAAEGSYARGGLKYKEYADSLWPPANASELGLNHCLRLLPHAQDTGGFFVCVIEKLEVPVRGGAGSTGPAMTTPGIKRAISPSAPDGPEDADSTKKPRVEEPSTAVAPPAEDDDAEEEEAAAAGGNGGLSGKSKPSFAGKSKKGVDNRFTEDPFFYLKPGDPEIALCVEHYGLATSLPQNRLFVRNQTGEASRQVYLSNAIVESILTHNPYERIRCISAGIRVFRKQDTNNVMYEMKCKWRIPSEGVEVVLPYMAKEKVQSAGWKELMVYLEHAYPQMGEFDTKYADEWNELPLGCHVVTFQPVENDHASLPLPLSMPVWRAKDSISLMIDKKEKSMLSLRVFGKDITGQNEVIKKDIAEVVGDAGLAAAPGDKGPSLPAGDEEDAMNA